MALGAYSLEGNPEAAETAYRRIEVALEPKEAQGLTSSAQILAGSRIFGESTTLVKTILDEEAEYQKALKVYNQENRPDQQPR